MSAQTAKFHVGQIIQHTLFDYRGVIVDVDPQFQGGDTWYERATRTDPPKDRPWYHVLVDGANYATYVAERNLEATDDHAPIKHRELALHFDHMENGQYVRRNKAN